MRVVVVGAGGVGGLFGGLLLRSGGEVAFVARGEHLRALRERGLRVASPLGDLRTGPLPAAEDPAALGKADLVVVAVKAWQVAEMAPRLRPLLREGTMVMPVQNGVEAADQLAAGLGEGPVVSSLCHVFSRIEAPGSIVHQGFPPRVTVGERSQRGPSERLERLCAALRKAGMEAQIAPDIRVALWEKLLFVEPLGSVGAITRSTAGILRSLPETRALLLSAMEEIAAVARAQGAPVAPAAIDEALARLDKLPEGATASMERDIIEGHPSELDEQTGAVVRIGRRAGVPTPVHTLLLAALLPQERKAREH